MEEKTLLKPNGKWGVLCFLLIKHLSLASVALVSPFIQRIHIIFLEFSSVDVVKRQLFISTKQKKNGNEFYFFL